MFEYVVDGTVAMSANVPSLHDTGVIAMEYDMVVIGKDSVESADKELKGDGFGPSNVFGSMEGLPSCA